MSTKLAFGRYPPGGTLWSIGGAVCCQRGVVICNPLRAVQGRKVRSLGVEARESRTDAPSRCLAQCSLPRDRKRMPKTVLVVAEQFTRTERGLQKSSRHIGMPPIRSARRSPMPRRVRKAQPKTALRGAVRQRRQAVVAASRLPLIRRMEPALSRQTGTNTCTSLPATVTSSADAVPCVTGWPGT